MPLRAVPAAEAEAEATVLRPGKCNSRTETKFPIFQHGGGKAHSFAQCLTTASTAFECVSFLDPWTPLAIAH